jgi:DNA-binding response OmpR family regulator
MAYIVLVEDDKDVAEVLCVALRAEGHRCFVIRTREGAERFFRRVRPDLVVMDCLLIGGDGLTLAQELASKADVPVIVTSGDTARAEQAEQAGLVCFHKPFRLSALAAAISSLLAPKDSAPESNTPLRHPDQGRRDARASRGFAAKSWIRYRAFFCGLGPGF